MKSKEILERLWEEMKLRQEHYWKSFNRFAIVIITINVVPYVRPEIVGPLDRIVHAFPIMAFLIAIVSTWYLGSEYQRQSMVRKAYYDLLSKECKIPRMPLGNWWEKLVAKRVGSATSLLFGFGFTGLSIVNFIILLLYRTKILDRLDKP